MCERGRADENRNVKKLSYATPRTGLRAMEAQQKPHGGKEGEDKEEGGRLVCVSVCMCV